jgi:hypothetical protein
MAFGFVVTVRSTFRFHSRRTCPARFWVWGWWGGMTKFVFLSFGAAIFSQNRGVKMDACLALGFSVTILLAQFFHSFRV